MTLPFCCTCISALKGWRVASDTAIQLTTHARPSPGPSVVCERCSHHSPPNCPAAALWWGAEVLDERQLYDEDVKFEEFGKNALRHDLARAAGAAEQNRNARSGSWKPTVWLWRRSPTCMRRVI
jgi:hypothetical protein